MDSKELQNLGLNEKEAKVYLAALALGKTTVQNIAQKAEIKRATAYVIIEALMKKGLISSYVEGKKQYFSAESPEKLKILFQDQETAIKRKEGYLEKLLPELRALEMIGSQKGGKPIVRYFEGKEGLKAMSEEYFMAKHKKPAKMIYSNDLLNKIFSREERNESGERRKKLNIGVKAIIVDETNELPLKTDLSERVKLSYEKYPITSDIAIFGNKVRMATQKGELVGLIIENKEIAKTMEILFDLAWQGANELKKRKKGSKK